MKVTCSLFKMSSAMIVETNVTLNDKLVIIEDNMRGLQDL